MKENKGKVDRRRIGENQEARKISCPGDTLLVINLALYALDLNSVLRNVVFDFWHNLE
jgi:hypothetical protein